MIEIFNIFSEINIVYYFIKAERIGTILSVVVASYIFYCICYDKDAYNYIVMYLAKIMLFPHSPATIVLYCYEHYLTNTQHFSYTQQSLLTSRLSCAAAVFI